MPASPRRTLRRCLLLGIAVVLVAAALPSPHGTAAAPLTVAPGSLVRWPGAGIERCGIGGNEWPPLGDGCYFAIDLLHPPGPLTLQRWGSAGKERAVVTVADYPYPTQRIELRDDTHVQLSPENLERSRRESAKVGALWSRRGPARFTLPLAKPLARLPQGGRFGARRIFNGEARSPHSGADYAAARGTPALAVADGVVVLADDHFFSGKSVFLDHGDGLITMYFHLHEIAVREGDEVSRGQAVGKVGATWRATGPHLHFGARWRGARIEPSQLFTEPDAIPGVG